MTEDDNYEKKVHLNDSELEYRLYLKYNENINTFFEIIVKFINKLSEKYIWNNEKLLLNKPMLIEGWYICEGKLDFSDNIEDEWFTVYLFIELTRKFNKELAVHLIDSDGEFLLIHVANYLPDWAQSASNNLMQNRVFIFDGNLHLIQPATKPSEITYLPAHGPLDFLAVKIVFDFPHLTCCSVKLQECLHERIKLFENFEKNYLHQTTCTVPAKLAWILSKEKDNFLNLAINRFCEKDPNDVKLYNTLNQFSAENLINYRVKFTKHLFAKLKSFNYSQHRHYNWPIGKDKAHDCLNLGLKLTCAYELLSKLEIIENTQFDSQKFKDYIQKLTNFGYFQDYLIDSEPYGKLFDEAKKNFINETHIKKSSINESLSKIPDNYIDSLNKEIDANQKNQFDDNEEWLYVDQTHLDDYLDMYLKGGVSSTYDFNLISNAFKKFVEPSKTKKDLFDGVDFEKIDVDDNETIDFDVELIEKRLKQLFSEKNENESDESDSFYEIENDDEIENVKDYEDQMDKELGDEKLLSRVKENQQELDIDLNLVSNALESYSSQLGFTGPVSNILKSLGI